MIRHIVLFSAREPKDVPTIVAALSTLADIPQARVLEVSENTRRDQLANDFDVVLYGEFDDAQALAAYKADARYQAAIEVVRPLREQRVAVDVEAAIR